MKARVKATGELVEVMQVYDKGKPSFERLNVLDTKVISYSIDELNFAETIGLADEEYWDKGKAEPICPDYWTRLEHQYAGMAMQGILTNPIGFENIRARGTNIQIETALLASEFAHALVEKMKEAK